MVKNQRLHFLMVKTFPILVVICLLYILYLIYKVEIFKWFCLNEDNSASCYIVSGLMKDNHNEVLAREYLEKSCELDYGKGCFNLAYNIEQDDLDRAIMLYEKACELNYMTACELLGRDK